MTSGFVELSIVAASMLGNEGSHVNLALDIAAYTDLKTLKRFELEFFGWHLHGGGCGVNHLFSQSVWGHLELSHGNRLGDRIHVLFYSMQTSYGSWKMDESLPLCFVLMHISYTPWSLLFDKRATSPF